jgi:hypothetical protein
MNCDLVVEGYEQLKQHLDISSKTRIMNRVFRVAQIDEKVLRLLGSDCYPVSIKPPENWSAPPSQPDTVVDIWGLVWKEVHYD